MRIEKVTWTLNLRTAGFGHYYAKRSYSEVQGLDSIFQSTMINCGLFYGKLVELVYLLCLRFGWISMGKAEERFSNG